jgi:hypothetical protein
MHVHIHILTRAYAYTCTCIYIYLHAHMYIHARAYTYTYTRICIYMHVHIHILTRAYAYTCTCTQLHLGRRIIMSNNVRSTSCCSSAGWRKQSCGQDAVHQKVERVCTFDSYVYSILVSSCDTEWIGCQASGDRVVPPFACSLASFGPDFGPITS